MREPSYLKSSVNRSLEALTSIAERTHELKLSIFWFIWMGVLHKLAIQNVRGHAPEQGEEVRKIAPYEVHRPIEERLARSRESTAIRTLQAVENSFLDLRHQKTWMDAGLHARPTQDGGTASATRIRWTSTRTLEFTLCPTS